MMKCIPYVKARKQNTLLPTIVTSKNAPGKCLVKIF